MTTHAPEPGEAPGPTLARGHVAYVEWLLRVIGWDGVLPMVIVFAPDIADYFFPNRWDLFEILGIALPIVAFFLRVGFGIRAIQGNHCGHVMRVLQYVTFGVALLTLVIFDVMLLLLRMGPPGAIFRTTADKLVFAAMVAIYLINMLVAMYPGRTFQISAD